MAQNRFNLIQALHQAIAEPCNQQKVVSLELLALEVSDYDLQELHQQVSHSMTAYENGVQEGVFSRYFDSEDPLAIHKACVRWLLERQPNPQLELLMQQLA